MPNAQRGGDGGMSITYETQRAKFESIRRKYLEYLRLYAAVNHGSLLGATPFDRFYWVMTYYSRYQDRRVSC
jgi:hypothetical protein